MKDDACELIVLFFILVFCVSFSYAVLDTAYHARENIELKGKNSVTRAQLCRPYYNDGTDRWYNCMGIQYVQPK